MTPGEWRALRAARTIRWSAEPEMLAWVGENTPGRSKFEVARAFAGEFGFWPTRMQLGQARALLGISDGPPPFESRWNEVPVGTERVRHGLVEVKVAERPSRPLAKDNWVAKQRLVWEREHGEALPPRTMVVFADHDRRNFDPANLVAVPCRLATQVNARSGLWHDRETLEAVVALCELGSAAMDARSRVPLTCERCGAKYLPPPSRRDRPPRTCPACRSKGLKASHAGCGEVATCEACGREYRKCVRNQRLCHECSVARRGRRPNG